MKLEKIERYVLELSKEEVLFLFEIVDKIKLDAGSPPQAFEILKRFQAFRDREVEESPPPEQEHKCAGCEETYDVESRTDPLSKKLEFLCGPCFSAREEYTKLKL